MKAYALMSSSGNVIQTFSTLAEARGYQRSIQAGQPRKRDSFGNLLKQSRSERGTGKGSTYIKKMNPAAKAVRLVNFTGTIRKNGNGTVSITGRKRVRKR